MTLSDAAGLALLALRDRRLVAAILRVHAGRGTSEDSDALPPRLVDETLLAWACRVRAPNDAAGWRPVWQRLEREAADQLTRAASRGITPLPFGDIRYPSRLAAIPNPPAMVWVRGDIEVLSTPTVAIVGSRAATRHALDMAKQLASDLAVGGITVVSGLARGVDGAAHRAALAASGRTVGVLGCGIDRIYPAEHGQLASEMEVSGAVVSEFPPGVPPLPHHFPMRNRIISGLAMGVVIVEAPEKSGALITASSAAEQGRDVMVVPGLVSGGRNRGGHLLIRDGAKLVESADDIFDELGIAPVNAGKLRGFADLPDTAGFTVDELAAQTGELPNVVLAQLLEMELAGQIQRLGGGRFIKVLR
jgi:DNA processing protein